MPDWAYRKARSVLNQASWAPVRIAPDGTFGLLEEKAIEDIAQALRDTHKKFWEEYGSNA